MRSQRGVERRYPVRVRIAVPPEELDRQLEVMHARLDETCGAEGWSSAPAGTTGIVNDALALYFEDRAFVARFCCAFRAETNSGSLCARYEARFAQRSGPA